MNCPICGKEKVDDRPFCGGCGHKFGANIPATNTTVSATNTPPAAPAAAPAATAPQTNTAPKVNTAPPAYTPPAYTPPTYNTYVAPPTQPQIPAEYKPLGAWMYCLWSILFSIPFVGLILLIVMSCGGTQNINLRNYARSYFCSLLIGLALLILLVIVIAVLGASLGSILNDVYALPVY